MKEATELYLATDEDREGEAISWHLLEVLNPPASMPVKRMVFHEITPQAIRTAMEHPRDIDRRLVDAQEARRLLDRIYGYGPLAAAARQKVGPGTTVGRVQSVATRLVVERERARMAFVSASYWDLDGQFALAADGGRRFGATLVQLDGRRLATGKDFGDDGVVGGEVAVLDQLSAGALAGELNADRLAFAVRSVERKPYRRRPSAPFITSTFQQEAGRKLRLSASMAMRSAQSLYEAGYITYMRTDSTTLSDTALTAARREIAERYGSQYLPDQPRAYAKKVKNAQEAHEAIRPAGDRFRPPDEVAREVNANDAKVYELIWKRTVASQMTDATGETVTVRLGAANPTPDARVPIEGHDDLAWRDVEFATSGTIISHQGFRLAYVVDRDEGDDAEEQERQLPSLTEGDGLDAFDIEAHGHETQPPARFTEASLVKRLEELGVGRPSTYASTIKTIQDRGYVWKKGTALVPSWKAFAVVNLLEEHFPDLVDYAFTARMEDDLDEIAGGDEELVPWLSEFYFGPADQAGRRAGGLKEKVSTRLEAIDAAAVNAVPIGLDPDGVLIVAKPGRENSPYLLRGEDTASIPDVAGARRADRGQGARAALGAQGRPAAGQRPGHGAADLRQERPVRSLRAARRLRRRERHQAEDGVAVLHHDARAGQPRRRARAAVAAPGGGRRSRRRGRDHRPERQVRSLSAEGRRRGQEGQPEPGQRGAAAHGDPRRGRGPVRPAQAASGPGGEATARASSASTRSAAGRWSSRTAGSVPTSPTARPTRRCGGPTTSRPSPTSARSELLADRRDRGPAPKKKKAAKKSTKKAAKKSTKKAPAKKAGAAAKKPAKRAAKKAASAVTPEAVAQAASFDDPF